MNTANQMAEEIYGLHCDIGRLEKEKEHWHTEFINEHEYAHMLEEQAEKTEAENAKLRKLVEDMLPFIAEETGYCVIADCFVYPACCDNNGDEECPAVTRIHERARELGVEVTS